VEAATRSNAWSCLPEYLLVPAAPIGRQLELLDSELIEQMQKSFGQIQSHTLKIWIAGYS
jgi:hypothetical protein